MTSTIEYIEGHRYTAEMIGIGDTEEISAIREHISRVERAASTDFATWDRCYWFATGCADALAGKRDRTHGR
ncbi:hypothetical protein SEA_KIDNEYBEAN_92 [Gordonia phage KidneyBean]|uniref:Uncharacterized protein n=1 Tax=Gordonia phage KidneyBean TaxID=2301603 RepID=A0A385UIL4_9CAUD|nr:hypothetical protein KNU11_gp92 [Gordonia phage KidneyBean]AYB69809.1 hypothetical protein SEA_KIDNEYBEAN_92 [Gordonia phage KidneyBean]AYD84207.1 hypothetical protein SEA_JIFALL16_93 [Gordonia phage Jifall16]QZD98935.1 hypothetical protein SEA_TRACKER_93 [Gordonia phage Tracker]